MHRVASRKRPPVASGRRSARGRDVIGRVRAAQRSKSPSVHTGSASFVSTMSSGPCAGVPQARRVEATTFSSALRDQNTRREGGPVPDFAPPVVPIHAAWLAHINRDEAILESCGGRAGGAHLRRSTPRAIEKTLEPRSPRSVGSMLGENPSPPVLHRHAEFVRAYRVITSIPKGLTLDFLA